MPNTKIGYLDNFGPFKAWPHPARLTKELKIPVSDTGWSSGTWVGGTNPAFKGNAFSAIRAVQGNLNAGLNNRAMSYLGTPTLVARNAARPDDYLTTVRKLRF